MADNTALNAGAGGDTIASDDIAGIKWQRVKLTLGADGVNDLDVSSGNPLPVSAASLPLPTGAATGAKQDTGNASLASIDSKTVADQSLDYDTGAGTAAQKIVGIALPASGGPVAGGTSSNPLAMRSAASALDGCDVVADTIGATKTNIGTANTPTAVFGWFIANPNASIVYVQWFNAQASAVTLGVTVPTMSLGIPASASANVLSDRSIKFDTALSIAITTTRAGAISPVSTVDYNVFYKQ